MSRRQILQSTAATSLATAAIVSSTILEEDADAELRDLGEKWRRSADAYDLATGREADLEKFYTRTPIPDALFRRRSDFMIFFGFTGDKCYWDGNDGSCYWYGLERSLSTLKNWTFAEHCPEREKDRTRLRISEILDAKDAWDAENRKLKEMCGLAFAEELSDRLNQENRALRARIIAMPARTIAGLCLKAEVFGWCRHETSEEVQAQADDDAAEGDLTDMTVLLSLGADMLWFAEQQKSARPAA